MDLKMDFGSEELLSPATGLEELLKKAKSSRKRQLEVPSLDHTSFIPETQHSNLVLMKAHKPVIEKMTTLFIGSVRKNYTAEMWDYDTKQWMAHLGQQNFFTIPIMPHVAVDDAINSREAIPKIQTFLTKINQLPSGEKIRVIVLGTGQSAFLYDSLTFLLREWKEVDGMPRRDKYMQFVTSGDTKDHNLNNFCQWLCISGVCETIEFYNTMHYHPFGFCSQEYAAHK